MQKTRFSEIFDKLDFIFFGFFKSSWKLKSLSLLSILGGYFLFTNLISHFISDLDKNKLIIVPLVILYFELITRIKPKDNSLFFISWLVLDKSRIGGIYALILEAFKLGS